MRLLQHRIAGPEPCPYLDGVSSSTETMLMTGVTVAELDELLERGSVRVPVTTFRASINLKRVLKRAAHLRLEVGEPVVDDVRLALYRRWHESREEERGWKPDRIGIESYAMQFCFPHAAAREFSYWEDEELVAVGIADETQRALSAVYCYYDPERAHLSLGTLNVLRALEYARHRRLAYVYLGYRVEDCPSLKYKGRFRPQERLHGRVEAGHAPLWEPA